MTDVLINGIEKNTININDRGLQYGDGLFETMAVHNGKIRLWGSHWQRLELGCKKLSIILPNKNTIEKEIEALCHNNKKSLFVIKLIVTRGQGQRGYAFTAEQNITRILSAHSWPDYPAHYRTEGVAVRYCQTTLSENIRLSEIKHLNRLEQILARDEWGQDDFQEGLMLTKEGYVVDGTMSNLFIIKDNKISTPDVSKCGVAGVMRKEIIKIAKGHGFIIDEVDIRKTDLELADEVFISNSLFGIWPVKQLEDIKFNTVGKVTQQLQLEINKLGF